MLQEHEVELLLDGCRGVMERQKIGVGVGVMSRLGDDLVLVEARHDLDRLGEQAVRLADHHVAFLELAPREIRGVALAAVREHPVSLLLPVLLGRPEDVEVLEHAEPGRGLTRGIEHPQALEDAGPVGRPLRVLGHGEPHGHKPPGRANAVVAAGHVAALAGGRRRALGQDAVLLQEVAHPVLGGGIHLPLGVVDAHVAGLAGLGLLGLLLGEEVPGVAGITGGDPEMAALLAQFLHLLVGLDPDLVAAPAAFHAVHEGHGLHVEGGHGLHDVPGLGVLAALELLDLGAVAVSAALGRRDLGLVHRFR